MSGWFVYKFRSHLILMYCPLIERHFKARYQDQRWLIYDEKRNYGIYYDLKQVHQVDMDATTIDRQIQSGHSQSFNIELDDDEVLYDQLWKDYFRSVNIEARRNMKLTCAVCATSLLALYE